MTNRLSEWLRDYGPATLCRADAEFIRCVVEERNTGRITRAAVLAILVGGSLYGFAFGVWRCPLQGAYSAAKMPILIFSVTACSIAINTMLAQVLGSGLSFRQVAICILLGLSTTSVLLGALSPVTLFLSLQCRPPAAAVVGLPDGHPLVTDAMPVFWGLLLLHCSVIGAAGLVGFARLYTLIAAMVPSRRLAAKVLSAWTLVSGFVGCELSWMLSPFLCKPNYPPHFVTRTYFEGNFYEHMYRAVRALRDEAAAQGPTHSHGAPKRGQQS